MEDGWIKIYPYRLLEWEWYDDANMFRLFMHLLLKANYKDKQWHGITIKRGQLVTSLVNLSIETGLSIRNIRTCLEKLTSTGEIDKQVTRKFTLITVCKYCKYQQQPQSDRHDSDTLPTNERHATDKQTTLTKEYKNNRNKDNNISPNGDTSGNPTFDVDVDAVKDFFNRTMANASIPKIRSSINGRRKEMLTARVREYGLDAVYEVITKAAASSFLNGGGARGFVADFEWLMRPNNFPKVLDGNYNTKPNNGTANIQPTGDPRQQERANLAAGVAATIARRFAEDDAREAALRKP